MCFIGPAHMCYLFAFSGFHRVLASVKSAKRCQPFDLESFNLRTEARLRRFYRYFKPNSIDINSFNVLSG